MSSNELDSQLRAVGVNKEQRKRLIAAARLGGIPNPLKQLGLREPASAEQRSRSRSSRRTALPAPVAPSPAGSAGPVALAAAPVATVHTVQGGGQRPLPLAPTPGVPGLSAGGPGPGQRLVRAPAVRPTLRGGQANSGNKEEEEDADLDSFLAGGRAIMAKAKAMGQARREQAAKEQVEVERQHRREQEQAVAVERARKEQEQERRRQEEERERQVEELRHEERRRQEEERERQEEERRREARRRARKEEKMRRKEQKKRQRAEEEEEDSVEEDPDEGEESDRRRRQQRTPSKGFFSQAFKGNQQQRALWSEPIKGHVSNNYKGTSDADLERRFRLVGAAAQAAGEKLMTEEEVLAMLRNRKSKGR